MGKYDIYGEESGWLCIKGINTMRQAKQILKNLIEFDKREGIEDIYTIRKII